MRIKTAYFTLVLGTACAAGAVFETVASPPILGPGSSSGGFLKSITGDCTTSSNSGLAAIICTKTNGVAFAASATTDTTNATHVTSGTLAYARFPALAGAAVLGGSGAGAPGALGIGNGLAIAGGNLLNADDTVYTVATLPTPAVPARAFVSDSTLPQTGNVGSVLIGGGANTVPAVYDGAAWRID